MKIELEEIEKINKRLREINYDKEEKREISSLEVWFRNKKVEIEEEYFLEIKMVGLTPHEFLSILLKKEKRGKNERRN